MSARRMTALLLLSLLSAGLLPAVAQNAGNTPATAIPGARPAPGAAGNTRPAVPAAPAAPAAAPAAPATPAAPAQAAAPAAAAPATPAAAASTPAAPTDKRANARKQPEADKAQTAAADTPSKPTPLKPPACAVADFRAIGIDITDERTRRTRATLWLQNKAKDCSPQQLIVIRNNRAQWLGTADSAELAAAVDGLLEAFAQTNPEVAILLYGTPPPPPPPPADNQTTTPPRR